jgi:CBS domain-containing protein
MNITLVRDLMQIGVPTCGAGVKLPEAIRRLISDSLEALVVLDEHGHAIGLFGRQEAIAAYGISGARNYALDSLTVADVMSHKIPEIPPDIPASAAVQLMLDQQRRELYLMHHDGGICWPSAVLRFDDILNHLAQ